MINNDHKVVALSGGVGGAKLALGLSKVLTADQLTIIANTADDFEHLGLSISPDLDTVMYTLAGLNDIQRGWGLAGESWNAMSALKQLGKESWFQLGDKDLATHIARTQALSNGDSLSQITSELCKRLGIGHPIVPMSEDPIRTIVHTEKGGLAFQHYFVREQCAPKVQRVEFKGIESARPSTKFWESLHSQDLSAILICPSNPFVSVSPIIQIPGVRDAMMQSLAPVIAVSPIVAGSAIKGPAAKMMKELNLAASATAIAEYYGDLLSGIVIDEADYREADAIRDLGISVLVTPTVMKTTKDRITLAEQVMSFAIELGAHKTNNDQRNARLQQTKQENV